MSAPPSASTSGTPLRIVIVGAGLGGLTLARMLHVRGLGSQLVCVLEAEESSDARAQGGTLDMHDESGSKALKEAGLWEAILPHLRPEGESMTIVDSQGVVVWDERERNKSCEGGSTIDVTARSPAAGGPSSRPEVDRAVLRRVLLESLPQGTVRWNSKLVSISRKAGEEVHSINLANGTTIVADLVVGADGAWSHVRPYLSSIKPTYSGKSFVDLALVDADKAHPVESALVGPGSFFCLEEKRGIIAQRLGNGSIRVYVALFVPEDWKARTEKEAGVNWNNAADVRAHILKQFAHWSPSLQSLIANTDDAPLPRMWPIYSLPVNHRWVRDLNQVESSVRGLTLLGDAAHLMPPSGEGANLAMLDGLELASALADYPGQVERALAVFEQAMWSRSEPEARDAVDMIDMMYGKNAPKGMVDFMKMAMKTEE